MMAMNEDLTMSHLELKSLSYYEQKQFEELKWENSEKAREIQERNLFWGYFVISLIATLIISGAM